MAVVLASKGNCNAEDDGCCGASELQTCKLSGKQLRPTRCHHRICPQGRPGPTACLCMLLCAVKVLLCKVAKGFHHSAIVHGMGFDAASGTLCLVHATLSVAAAALHIRLCAGDHGRVASLRERSHADCCLSQSSQCVDSVGCLLVGGVEASGNSWSVLLRPMSACGSAWMRSALAWAQSSSFKL